MGELVMTDPFHRYRRPGPRRTWGLFTITWYWSSAGWTSFLMSNHMFLWIFSKMYLFFYLSYWLHLLLIVVVISSKVQFLVLIGGFGSFILIFVVFMPIWTSWLLLDRVMVFWFVLGLKSLIAAVSQSSVSLALVASNRGWGTPHLVPRVSLFMLGKYSASSGRASWSVLATSLVCFVFAVG